MEKDQSGFIDEDDFFNLLTSKVEPLSIFAPLFKNIAKFKKVKNRFLANI